jgi:predicted deacylase
MSYIYSNILDFYHLKGVIPSYQDISPLFLTAFTMEIVVGETGGDVTKNQVLFANLKKNLVNQKVTDAARQGTVMVRFGNGGGPRVMIVAGVHGNELPSQIMAMRLINELNGKKIRGTVYIIPFAAPWAVEKNDRLYKWINLNRVSNNNGTPTNTIAKLAKKLNIKYFGDFHCTQPGGSPGINCILYYPGSKNMGRHIQSHSGGSLINVLQYAGLLTTVTSNLGITSIICEAQSPHGTVQPGSLGIQYKFQKAFLNYAGII